jgi:PIN domain nuclease of toxin-antitoxin system
MLLLDSHVLCWYFAGSAAIGRSARRLVAREGPTGGLRACALSFIELEHALRQGRLRGVRSVAHLRDEILRLGVAEIAADGGIALRAADFRSSLPDAFDALIAATADVKGQPFLSADAELLAWRAAVRVVDARK